MRFTLLASAGLLALSAGAAQAAVNFSLAGPGLSAAQSAEASFLAGLDSFTTETFENFTAGDDTGSGSVDTSVGNFRRGLTAIDGTGDCVFGCDNLQILDAATTPFNGRFNTTPGGGNWLDSNDLTAISWDLVGVSPEVSAFGLYLTDANDVGATLTVSTTLGNDSISLPSPQGNGSIFYLTAASDTPILGARVDFNVAPTNDGFGIDDVTIDVPEPATLGLIGAGLAGVGLATRRRRTA